MSDTPKSTSDILADVSATLKADELFYDLDEDERSFFKSLTGIQDDEILKQHIIKIQEDAYRVFPYPCIRRFAFAKLKISRQPSYNQLLTLGKRRPGAIFLDIGCCFGNDVRKAVLDGFPMQGVIGSDIEPAFWQLGHRLFNSTPDTFSVPFIPGDAFDPAFLDPAPPFYSPSETPVPTLSSLSTLTPLNGHISAIHASSFFHLFPEAEQLYLAKALAGLLSSEPGSLIFGSHGAKGPVKGTRVEQGGPDVQTNLVTFWHSPSSWKELWDGEVFKKGTVKVEAELREVGPRDLKGTSSADGSPRLFWLVWSVMRL